MRRPDLRRAGGFTFLELLLVMALIGVILGIGSLGLESLDQGARGLREAVGTFLETSRDRARATGFPVVVEVQPPGPGETGGGRLSRFVFRPVLEANFEPAWTGNQGVVEAAPARVGAVGRCGGGLDLGEGGGAEVQGRGGRLRLAGGLALEMDVLPATGSSASLLEWDGLLSLRAARNGSLVLLVEGRAEEGAATTRLEAAAGSLVPGRWQHIRVRIMDGQASLAVDGSTVAAAEFPGGLPDPEAFPFLGDRTGRFLGRMDELVVHTRVEEPGPKLPDAVEIRLGAPRLVFDRYGLLDATEHPGSVPVSILESEVVAAAFRVGRFSEEAPSL